MHPMEKYLAIEPRKNQLTFPITSELDIHGWDLKKNLATHPQIQRHTI
jgi:uncharacterized protein